MTDIGQIALEAGVTGQDGTCLAGSLLLKAGVHGVRRLSSSFNIERPEYSSKDPRPMPFGDMTRPIPPSCFRLGGAADLMAEMVHADPAVAARNAALGATSLPHA